MLSTTGELLCFCDMRKLQWYIDKGLAEKVEEDPPTIRLLFEHKNADQQVGSSEGRALSSVCSTIINLGPHVGSLSLSLSLHTHTHTQINMVQKTGIK